MKWQDNCTNSWHGVDDAGGCARGCLDVFVMIVTHPSPRRPGVVVAAMTKKVFCRSTNGGAGRCSFSATGRAANPDLALSGGDAGATLPGGTGRDDYVAGTIAMSGANGAVVVEVTNVGDEAVEIQQGDQLTTIEPGATSMFSSDFCAQRLCMANSQILQNGSARAVRPRRRRAARDRSLVPRSRAGSIGIGLFSEGDHTGRMGGRPAVWKPWWRAARSYRQGRSSNANGLRWRVLARASRNYLNISNT